MENNSVQIVWGTPILDQGFANVPNMIIRNYRKLGITHGEFGLIMQLISYKHDEKDPFPSQETLANNLGTSTRSVRKLISSLENKGLLWIEYQYIDGKRGSNVYILKPLVDKCLEMFGESKLPDEKPKRKTFRKVKRKSLQEPEVPVVPEPEVPVVPEPDVPVAPEPDVPSNITIEKNNYKKTIEKNNLSIKESEIIDTGLPLPIQKALIIKMDRLISDKISLNNIATNYQANKEKVNEYQYAEILQTVLTYTKTKIVNINSVMHAAITKYLTKKEEPVELINKNKDIVPEWFEERQHERQQKDQQPENQYTLEDLEKVKAKFKELKGNDEENHR